MNGSEERSLSPSTSSGRRLSKGRSSTSSDRICRRPRRTVWATCAARRSSRSRQGVLSPTPSCGAISARRRRTIRAKRAQVVAELPDWEELREAGRQLKVHTMAQLPDYLAQLESAVIAPRRRGALGSRRQRGQRYRH